MCSNDVIAVFHFCLFGVFFIDLFDTASANMKTLFQESVSVHLLNTSADAEFSLPGCKTHFDNIAFACYGPDGWGSLCILMWTRNKSTWGKKETQMRAHNVTLLPKC